MTSISASFSTLSSCCYDAIRLGVFQHDLLEKVYFVYSEYRRTVVEHADTQFLPFAHFLLRKQFSWDATRGHAGNYKLFADLFQEFVQELSMQLSLSISAQKKLFLQPLATIDAYILDLFNRYHATPSMNSLHDKSSCAEWVFFLRTCAETDTASAASLLAKACKDDIVNLSDVIASIKDMRFIYCDTAMLLKEEEDFSFHLHTLFPTDRAQSLTFFYGSDSTLAEKISQDALYLNEFTAQFPKLSTCLQVFFTHHHCSPDHLHIGPVTHQIAYLRTVIQILCRATDLKDPDSYVHIRPRTSDFMHVFLTDIKRSINNLLIRDNFLISAYLRGIGWEWKDELSSTENAHQCNIAIFSLLFLQGHSYRKTSKLCAQGEMGLLENMVQQRIYALYQQKIAKEQEPLATTLRQFADHLADNLSVQQKIQETRCFLHAQEGVQTYLALLEGTYYIDQYRCHIESMLNTLAPLHLRAVEKKRSSPTRSSYDRYLLLTEIVQILYQEVVLVKTAPDLLLEEVFSKIDISGIEWVMHKHTNNQRNNDLL